MVEANHVVKYRCKLIRAEASEAHYHVTYRLRGAFDETLLLLKSRTSCWDLIEASVGKTIVIERERATSRLVGLRIGRRQTFVDGPP